MSTRGRAPILESPQRTQFRFPAPTEKESGSSQPDALLSAPFEYVRGLRMPAHRMPMSS